MTQSTTQIKNNFFILTGAMGSGKSTILKELKAQGITVVEEPARQILAEQRAFDGEGVYDRDPKLFAELMLSRSIARYKQYLDEKGPIIFDRGVADNIAYFSLFELDTTAAKKASELYRYNPQVLITPSWEEIYTTDDERTISYEQAQAFGNSIQSIYRALGYELNKVPKCEPKKRGQFILDFIAEISD